MMQHSTLTVTAGTDLTGGGSVPLGGSTTLNLDTTKVPLLAAANVFKASQSVVGSIFPDVTGTNNSSFAPGVIFGGTGSGESITSNRANSSFNQFGLDFYTNFAARLSIYQDGTIGMGNSTEKFGGTQVFINPPAGDNSNIGLIAQRALPPKRTTNNPHYPASQARISPGQIAEEAVYSRLPPRNLERSHTCAWSVCLPNYLSSGRLGLGPATPE